MSAQLAQAAQAVIDRWDSPKWEWTKQGPTADLIADLRKELAAFEAAPQQAQAPTPGVCDLVQVEGLGKLPRSDAESWLRHRAGIIEACRAEGYSIVTTAQGVHLMKLGKIAAQAPGWQLVPVEPTQEMLAAVVTSLDEHLLGREAEQQYREDWAAMLQAAPQQGSKS